MNRFLILVCAVLLSTDAIAQDARDGATYCAYVTEQAKAQADFLRAPTYVAGAAQPDTGTPPQLYTGMSESLTNLKKAGLTMKAAAENCALYNSTIAVQLHLQYAIPTLEKAALANRVQAINAVERQLNTLIVESQKKQESQDMTRLMLYSLQTTLVKLELDKSTTVAASASIYVPPLSNNLRLKEMLAIKQSDEEQNQKSLDKIARENNWDLSVGGGIRHQLNPFLTDTVDGYGTFVFTYNLGSPKINRHLDQAAANYGEWKKVQQNDAIQTAVALQKQVADNIAALESKAKVLQAQEGTIESNLALVKDVATSVALSFNMQLRSDQLLLRVEIADTQFRLDNLKQYLQDNF
jgi:hypothetical protein